MNFHCSNWPTQACDDNYLKSIILNVCGFMGV